VLLPHLQGDPEAVKGSSTRPDRGRALHPNLVAVYDFGHSSGVHFIAMEHIDGWVLAELLHASARQRRKLPVAAAAFVVAELASALAYLHARASP